MDSTDQSNSEAEFPPLSETEIRVLGCLLEKEMSTPEYYPLTLNALVNACNQKSNRSPLMVLEQEEVRDALDSLREKHLAMMFHGADSRVPKFKHTLTAILNLDRPEIAILCELMVRGPQTPGELRGRCERLHAFALRDEVEERLRELEKYPNQPLVTRLPRRPGQKEQRYAHLFGANPPEADDDSHTTQTPAAPTGRIAKLAEEVERQNHEIASLKSEIETIKNEFEEFRKQFE